MSLTNSSRKYATDLRDVSVIMSECAEHFEWRGYSVQTEKTTAGGFISLTKGGVFETIAGLKTGLNITITRIADDLEVKMEVGIFGKQSRPTAIAGLGFVPVHILQRFGRI